jgi:hypothetical protein
LLWHRQWKLRADSARHRRVWQSRHHGADRDPRAGERVTWTALSSNAPAGWEGTTIAFEQRRERSGTVLACAGRGFRQTGDGYAPVNIGCAY